MKIIHQNLDFSNQSPGIEEISSPAYEILKDQIQKTRQELPFSLKVADMARLTGYSENSIYLMLEAGDIPGAKKYKGWRVPRDLFLCWWYGNGHTTDTNCR